MTIDKNQFNSLMESLSELNEVSTTDGKKTILDKDGNPISKELEDALGKMAGEMSAEQSKGGPQKTGTPKRISRVLSSITFEDPYLAIIFSRKNTDYWEDSSMSTAGVAVKGGRIQFYYSPSFIAGLSTGETIFLLKHELYHILRRHQTRGQKIGAVGDKHLAMNIAADSIINRDLLHDKSLTTTKAVPIKGGIFLHKNDISGDFNYVDVMAKKDYKGKVITEPITQFLWDHYEPEKQEPQEGKGKPGPPGPPQPFRPKVGDIISTDDYGEYGRVTKVSGSKIDLDIEYDVISEAEALAAKKAAKKSSFMKLSRKPKTISPIVFD